MKVRPAAAIIVPGGIGSSMYVPALLDLLCRIGEAYRLRLYSFSRTDIHPRLASVGAEATIPPASIQSSTILKSGYLLWRIFRDSKRIEFSIIHGFWTAPQGALAVLTGKLFGIPCIVSILGGDVAYLPEIAYGGLKSRLHRIVVKCTLAAADTVTLLTNYQRIIMASARIHAPGHLVIPFGADIRRYDFQSTAIGAVPRFGFIGSINPVKDPYTLLLTFSCLLKSVECRLSIAGPDLMHGKVHEYAKTLGIYDKIEWLGAVPHVEIPQLLRSLDMLLLTSKFEGEGVVVMEAFAAGTLVAGTNVGLLADLADESVTAEPGDAVHLAAKILRILRDPLRAHEMRVRNRRFAEEWTIDRTADEFLGIYNRIRKPIASRV